MTTCDLCDLPTPDPPVEGDDGSFCCRGCLEVADVLGDVEPPEGSIREALGVEQDADRSSADGEAVFLAVDGMHCGTCEAFLEARALNAEGVLDADASYANDAMRLVYDPDQTGPERLSAAVSGTGYRAHERDDDTDRGGDDALVRFLIGGGLFGMMAMVWYVVFLYPTYFGYEPFVDLGGLDGLYLFAQLWLLTTFVLGYTGLPLLRGAYVSLRARRPNADLLVAMAATGAYVYSTIAMLVGRTDLYFDVTIAVVLVVAAGNYYEGRIKARAAGLLSDLAVARVEEATLISGDVVPVEGLTAGDEVVVRPGERVPIDGDVVGGVAAVDESLVTGEPLPRTRRPGDSVRGGTVVTDAPLVVSVDEDATSTLDRLLDLLWSIRTVRPGAQRVADRLATAFVPVVALLSIAGAGGALLTGADPVGAALVGLTVLIVSCPCALGLATPMAVSAGVKTAAEEGIVIASGVAFEAAPEVDVVVLDKTGTLTDGRMAVESVTGPPETLARAAAVERLSAHPIADAVVEAAAIEEGSDRRRTERSRANGGVAVASPEPVGSVEVHDRGVEGIVDGERVLVGHPKLFERRGWTLPEDVLTTATTVRNRGSVPVVVGTEGIAEGVIAVGDVPRSNWDAVVERLTADGREVVVLTGDEGAAVDRFRDHPDVSEVFAGVPPEGKAETVERLRARGTVAMVGDGSNDAPALAAADLGIALDSGTELAADAADAVILGDDLTAVSRTFEVAAGTNRRIRENLAWAFVYNAIAIPLAIVGLLNPLLAAAAMATSSVLVVVNSSREP